MPIPSRLLLVDDVAVEWELALAGFSEGGLTDQAAVVKDRDEALDYLHARGAFRTKVSELPAVVVLGPNMKAAAALALLKDIRADASMRRLPVVMVNADADRKTVRAAYRQGANSVVTRHSDAAVQQARYATLARFWGFANEPPGSGSEREASPS